MIQPAFASSPLETLQARAKSEGLAHHTYWLRLLHYRRNLFGIYESEIDDPTFFASPHGRRDPQAELDATLAAFFKEGPAVPHPDTDPDTQSARCRYPARFSWLKEKLAIDPSTLPAVDCARYDKWREEIDPRAASLVFASYYMNNPSSMYGHTFLLLKKKGRSADNELLDYAVNFAADLENDNGFLYAMKGLFGGYHGHFSTFPYYMKVQEYSNLESRDLWTYDLNLSPAAMDRLVEHLWELGNTRLRYFFFNKNCSYYLMPLLEVVEPDRDFAGRFLFRAIPVDTIRSVIEQPGMLGDVKRRPSHVSKLLAERKLLTENEIRAAESLAVTPVKTGVHESMDPGVRRDDARSALVLDAAYDLFRYHVGFNREQPAEVQRKDQELLKLRSSVPLTPPSPTLPASRRTLGDLSPKGGEGVVSPVEGHPTRRVEVSYGFSNHSRFEELSFRPALHDQEDPNVGYLPGSKLEMFNTQLRYDNNRNTLYVNKFDLVDLLSITPWDRWIHPPSWKVNTGLAVAHDLPRDPENSLYYGLNLGTGYSAWLPGTDKALVYGMGEMELELGHVFSHTVRFGGGPAGGLLWMPTRYWRARIGGSYYPYAVGGTPSTVRLGVYQSVSITKVWEIRAKVERENQYKEVLLSLVRFL